MDVDDHGEELPRFGDWAPTQFDSRGLGSAGREDWRVLPVIQTRDSGLTEQSNFEVAQRILDEAGVEYDVVRMGHWGPGWVEILIVSPTAAGLTVAGEIACSLSEYPILDDMDLGRRQAEASEAAWDHYGHMNSYRIRNRVSGADLGTYAGRDEQEAILAMLADAGGYVTAGEAGTEDYDRGMVVAVTDDGVEVAWESGVRTVQPAELLRPDDGDDLVAEAVLR